MMMNRVVVALFFTLALVQAEVYAGQVVMGSVACLDCTQNSDLSGIQVVVKCDKVKNHNVAYADEAGTFEAKLPSDKGPNQADPSNCMAQIVGGPQQVYVSTKDSIVPIMESTESGKFTTSKPLSFYKSCPMKGKCGANNMGFGSSKTLDLPLPRELGLAPSIYYIPFFPIIGIP